MLLNDRHQGLKFQKVRDYQCYGSENIQRLDNIHELYVESKIEKLQF